MSLLSAMMPAWVLPAALIAAGTGVFIWHEASLHAAVAEAKATEKGICEIGKAKAITAQKAEDAENQKKLDEASNRLLASQKERADEAERKYNESLRNFRNAPKPKLVAGCVIDDVRLHSIDAAGGN